MNLLQRQLNHIHKSSMIAIHSHKTRSISSLLQSDPSLALAPKKEDSKQLLRYISSSSIIIERNENASNKLPPKEELKFGSTFSDHMLTIGWKKGEGWNVPRIIPYQNLSISPASSVLNYALTCFEGMKAYKSLSNDKDMLLFRPNKNLDRLETSIKRLEMISGDDGEDLNKEELLNCIVKLIQIDGEKWIPYGEGYSLYIRPVVIGTHPFLGVAPPTEALLYVITSPVGPYYKHGFQPVRLTADSRFIRAWPGGSGNCKVGANYGPTLLASTTAANEGYDQVLWLYDDYITEVGTMNVFFALKKDNGTGIELVTPPLHTRDDILPGITRLSIIELVQQWSSSDNITMSERDITMSEIQQAINDNTLVEAFGAGTAAVVSPISCIHYKGKDLNINATGDITKRIWKEIIDIQYGKVSHEWSLKI